MPPSVAALPGRRTKEAGTRLLDSFCAPTLGSVQPELGRTLLTAPSRVADPLLLGVIERPEQFLEGEPIEVQDQREVDQVESAAT